MLGVVDQELFRLEFEWAWMVLAVAAGLGFGLIAAIPSLRTRGASLAIVTLASGLAMGEIFFKRPGWFGLDRGVKTSDPPELFGIEFGPNSDFVFEDGKIPTGIYGLFLLVVAIACCVSVMRLRRSRLGEQMLAVRANERAAAAAGVNVAAIKLAAFGISSFFAALGGTLTAFSLGTYGPDSFGIFASLTILAFAYLGGISTVGGAITAGTLFAEGIGVVATEEWFGAQLRRLVDQGYTMLLVDHDMGLVLNVCDYIHMLVFGELTASGTPDEMRNNPEVIAAYLGHSGGQA